MESSRTRRVLKNLFLKNPWTGVIKNPWTGIIKNPWTGVIKNPSGVLRSPWSHEEPLESSRTPLES
jgi:hypothetical protein